MPWLTLTTIVEDDEPLMVPALGRIIDCVSELATEAIVMMFAAKMIATMEVTEVFSNASRTIYDTLAFKHFQ